MTNFSENIDISVNQRNAIPFLVDGGGVVSNSSIDLIGYTSAGSVPRGEVPYPADGTTEIFEIASTSVNDTLLGSGARTVQVTYLDGSGELKIHLADMNGQTPVALPAASRILNAIVRTGGPISTPSSDKTAGDVSIGQSFTLGVPSDVYMQIDPVSAQSTSGFVTIPANHRGVFRSVFASGPVNDAIEFFLFSRATGQQWMAPAGFFSDTRNEVTQFIVNAFFSSQDIELRAISTSGPAQVHVLLNVLFIPVPAE